MNLERRGAGNQGDLCKGIHSIFYREYRTRTKRPLPTRVKVYDRDALLQSPPEIGDVSDELFDVGAGQRREPRA